MATTTKGIMAMIIPIEFGAVSRSRTADAAAARRDARSAAYGGQHIAR